ncbi:DUF6243 family protein [Streptomyces angustmyceticus]|uniref:Uncharacterized protein n=1 Tax=Streptomyces angustmyceticus TaxID=285578 RepID=A0A5J4LL82_9ACTN|nr:DUF6243 family protein [Streptomyces angustmyceticus]UAL69487.1 DUF6243 family protein [Streptomyces angustmyceticus]GES32751.1 hypothetical protein San01_52390 [Streptomyces angustmyceticus]
MSRGNAGGMLGVGGTRTKLSRGALRGGGGADAAGRARGRAEERRQELLRRFQERVREE